MLKALLVLFLALARGEGPNLCSVTGYVSDEGRDSIPWRHCFDSKRVFRRRPVNENGREWDV